MNNYTLISYTKEMERDAITKLRTERLKQERRNKMNDEQLHDAINQLIDVIYEREKYQLIDSRLKNILNDLLDYAIEKGE